MTRRQGAAAFAMLLIGTFAADAADGGGVTLSLDPGASGLAQPITLLLMLTVLSIVPSLLMMMTSFTRLYIVLSFFRQAMGIQQALPNRIIAALALFLTFFIMMPTWQAINRDALQPYQRGELAQSAALTQGMAHLKTFMLRNTREGSLLLFMELGGVPAVETLEELPLSVVVPAFMVSELKTAFQMAFLIYLPFLVIDMLIATLLMSMGMMMMPPVMISMPFKLLLFILVGGWELLIRSLVTSFM